MSSSERYLAPHITLRLVEAEPDPEPPPVAPALRHPTPRAKRVARARPALVIPMDHIRRAAEIRRLLCRVDPLVDVRPTPQGVSIDGREFIDPEEAFWFAIEEAEQRSLGRHSA